MGIYLGELIGTAVMILFGGGVVANVVLNRSKAAGGGWIVIAFGWGFAVTIAIYAAAAMGGVAHFNPAVTVGQAVVGNFPWVRVPLTVLCQLLGAMLGALLVWLHFMPHFKITENAVAKRDVFCTTPQINNYVANYISEIIGTLILVFAICFIGENSFTDGLNPIMIGFLITAIGLSLGGTTGYAINPVRDLGPRIMHALLPISGKTDSNWKYALVPIIGPLVGGTLGAGLYLLFYQGNGYAWVALSIVAIAVVILFALYCNKRYLGEAVEKLL